MKGIQLEGMILRKVFELRTVSLMDLDFAKVPITRRSIGGELHTLGGYLTTFSSKGEKLISEYKSLSKRGLEAKFKQML